MCIRDSYGIRCRLGFAGNHIEAHYVVGAIHGLLTGAHATTYAAMFGAAGSSTDGADNGGGQEENV